MVVEVATVSNQSVTNKRGRIRHIIDFFMNTSFRMYMILSAFGLLLGRAVILDFLNPFCTAFFAAAMVQKLNLFVMGTSILLGVLSVGDKGILLKYIIAAIVLIIPYAATRKMKVNRKLVISAAAALINLAAGYFIFYVQNYYLYDLLMLIIESILIAILIYIYDRSLPVIKNYKNRRLLSSEEVVAVAVMAAFCFVGTEIYIAGFSVKNIAVIFIIMIFAYLGNVGTGAAVGIIMGIVQALSGSILPSAIGVYGLCAMMCGILKNLGRYGCPLGFIISNALMTFYINGSTEVLIRFYEILIASFLFVCIPQNYMKKLSGYKLSIAGEYLKEKSYSMRIKENTIERLSEFAGVYKSLADTLKDTIQDRSYFSHTDAAQIIDQVVGKTCSDCGLAGSCWKRNFYNSYQYLFNLLTIIENGGKLKKDGCYKGFKERCLKPEEIIENLKYYYDMYRNGLGWKKKINESRLLVSDQLKEVSAVVSDLALRIDMDVDFDRDMEELIMVGLDNDAVRVKDVIVARTGNTMDVDIRVDSCGGKRECIKNIIPIVNRVTGKKFNKREMTCDMIHGSICSIKLKEAQRYQIATGIARMNKSGAISGDNYSFIELKDGKFMLALSDGMGTGPKAALESSTTITLLEKFLYAGFDKDVALKAINSLMLLKSNDETYSTVDMTVINQYNGEVEFIKVGAVSTFIKNEEGVQIIKTGTLPVGILSRIDVELVRKKLKDGDFVVMVTDGVLDCNREIVDKEKWLAELIRDVDTRNPQRLAEEILQSCLQANGGEAPDDMTVMAAKVWEAM
ncbi:MAG TPA: stage II sporulation protein E [Bacillota bacterium]|nr:stage II sporulation protein E [Bacillota bacterium]HPA53736.1 stage II sporulation protein E [Bacillota bacterium]HPX69794.1 stage II sporulation protein E [Bacillota bacterium]HQA65582.1 stage II sporulation protein E [Bacillota bacterium]HQQ45069.1 stage II sporulation protein E [Bacillota bacterium]